MTRTTKLCVPSSKQPLNNFVLLITTSLLSCSSITWSNQKSLPPHTGTLSDSATTRATSTLRVELRIFQLQAIEIQQRYEK